MNDYFHYTNSNSIEYIRQEGLVPQIGPRTESIGDVRRGVFLSIGMLNSITMYSAMYKYYNNYIENTMTYGSFYDYLGGYGYCLTVNNLDYNSLFIDPVDCYYINTIPPENINVLVLKNKNTNQIIDSRETVLLYGLKKLLNDKEFNPDTRYQVNICELHNYLKLHSEVCDFSEYDLEEYSLQFYNWNKHAIKPFIIKPLKFI